MENGNILYTVKDKLIITANIKVLTGMHISASNDFSPIGAVDSVVVKDPLTGKPIIPGSSIKGKLRTVMAKIMSDALVMPPSSWHLSILYSYRKRENVSISSELNSRTV